MIAALAGCAKQGMPSGGPKDTEPPRCLTTKPVGGTTQFAAKEFYIQFDEYVVVKDAENNILVSPPMANKPEYKTKGKGLLVKLNDTLRQNTTYLFQFKDAIADFTEGNVLPSLEYVFSTGHCLDSMTLDGTVLDAHTLSPVDKTVSVLLLDTAAPDRPAYVTRCDKDGQFKFNYIRPASYSVLALVDDNKNLIVDTTETVAFVDSVFIPHTSTDTSVGGVSLFLFSPDMEKQRVTSADFKSKGMLQIVTKKAMKSPTIDAGAEKMIWRMNDKRDTLTLWTVRESCDSLMITLRDSTGINDTLSLKWRQGKKKSVAAPLTTPLMRVNTKNLHYFDTLRLIFSTPLDLNGCSPDSAAWIVSLRDSTTACATARIDSNLLCAYVVFPFRQGEKYSITFPKERFVDIYGKANDSLSSTITVSSAEEYGNLYVDIVPTTSITADHFIVQLLDEKDRVVAQHLMVGQGRVGFPHLKPAKYRARVVIDENGNGLWDTGNFFERRQPEKVQFLDKVIDVRANWEYEERFLINGN